MNATESRFCRIKRLSEEQIGHLHEVERVADVKWRDHPDGDDVARGIGWNMRGLQVINSYERHLPPFWNPRLSASDQSRILAVFFDHPEVRRAFVMVDDFEKTEVEAMHAADWRVWKYGPLVGTGAGDEMRSKAAA